MAQPAPDPTAAPKPGAPPPFAVAVCTRNRPEQLRMTLAALDRGSRRDFPLVVVDQSDEPDPALVARADQDARFSLVTGSGRGLSRARNFAWRSLDAEWIVFVDDDCIVAPDWAERLAEELAAHPEADFVSGHVGEGAAPGPDYVAPACFPVREAAVRSGRWTPPGAIGFGVCMAIRRTWIERLGGWDERLGAGIPEFPAGEDVDFNYRLLRAGGTAYLTPRVRTVHEQWRTEAELPGHYRGYMAGASGFAMKTLRQGDVLGGLWILGANLEDLARTVARALRRRSRLRARIAWAKLRGFVSGTARGLARSW